MLRRGVPVAFAVFKWGGVFVAFVATACAIAYGALAGGLVGNVVYAEEPLASTNYKFEESVLGGGGLHDSNSSSYHFTSTLGESIAGETESTNFNVKAGNKSPNDPVLGFAVTNSNVNFGAFSTTAGTTATANFAVSNYTSYGYAVHIVGNTPTNGAKSLPAMGTTGPDAPEASANGIEQFGINLVANTFPASVGANPDQGQFGFGVATSLYDDPNAYRYASGEAIASAPKSSGVTEYTITFVVNVAALTPGGKYIANQTLICTGTY